VAQTSDRFGSLARRVAGRYRPPGFGPRYQDAYSINPRDAGNASDPARGRRPTHALHVRVRSRRLAAVPSRSDEPTAKNVMVAGDTTSSSVTKPRCHRTLMVGCGKVDPGVLSTANPVSREKGRFSEAHRSVMRVLYADNGVQIHRRTRCNSPAHGARISRNASG